CSGNVKTADHTKIPIFAKGSVMLRAKLPSGKGQKIVLEEALYVPSLAGVNLLSWRAISRKGYVMYGNGDDIFIHKGSLTGHIVCWATLKGLDDIVKQTEEAYARLATYRQWHEAF